MKKTGVPTDRLLMNWAAGYSGGPICLYGNPPTGNPVNGGKHVAIKRHGPAFDDGGPVRHRHHRDQTSQQGRYQAAHDASFFLRPQALACLRVADSPKPARVERAVSRRLEETLSPRGRGQGEGAVREAEYSAHPIPGISMMMKCAVLPASVNSRSAGPTISIESRSSSVARPAIFTLPSKLLI